MLTGAMPALEADGPAIAPVVDARWPGFATVLRRCLAVNAKDRYVDARALGAALAEARDPGPDQMAAHVSSSRERATRALGPSDASAPGIAQEQAGRSAPHAADVAPERARGAVGRPETSEAPSDTAPRVSGSATNAPGPTPQGASSTTHAPRTGDARHGGHHEPGPQGGGGIAPRPPSSSRRWLFVVAGVVAAGAIAFAIVKLASSRRGESTPPREVVQTTKPTPKMLQVTTTLAKQWPAQTPVSVALDPGGTRFAYTTGGGGVFVRQAAGGAAVEWKRPVLIKGDREQVLATPRAVGWFADGSLAVLGATSNALHLVRLREGGATESLHQDTQRFRAAVERLGWVGRNW